MVTMMVGYAIFSETITINGTATAKGNFGLNSVCELVTEDIDLGDGSLMSASTGTGICKVEGNKITTTSALSKPTDLVSYRITITNNGSIPAVLKTIDSSNNVGADLQTTGDIYYFDRETLLMGMYNIIMDGQLQDFYGDNAIEEAKIVLQPNETIELLISHGWMDNDNIGGYQSQPVLPKEGVTMNYNIVLGFEQITN